MKLAQQYLETIEKKLRELGDKIDELNAKAKSEAKSKYDEKLESIRAQMSSAFTQANQSIDSQLNEWGQKIEELTDKTKREAKEEYEDIVKKIRPRLEEFRGELNLMKKSSDEAWADIKTGTVNAWKELKNSLTNAASKFK